MPTDTLVARFLRELSALKPLSVWAHGSLAGGDYQEGRSDLDLIAVLPGRVGPRQAWQVAVAHHRLRAEPLAGKLHCSYLTPHTLAGPDRSHLTWAHGGLTRRPVTPVTRRELHDFGLVLHGEAPTGLLPPVTGRQLRDFVVRDQRDFWRPAVRRRRQWRQDAWVDLGLLTFARATVTLRDGRLVSKRQALAELSALGAPEEVVADIARRRYEDPAPADGAWLVRRAELTRAYLGPAIDALVTAYG
ncbi:nucleotidyltransferase domain-containing protein [Streptomyces actinomycinicus]|uniref:Nucleotidyltransferase domain-containing protein n=1 Tax=Streptomyces actinomycinicus TaxID=1695166 RepID=A0A937JS67_9ACTN|nr:nucleotidyltransferase domain-containing protein [Streptomyces actinomycinicus]MBL1086457.1 nucleotidyltransferase domain-containing protein [Streptomyces actinomycinicus]